MDHNERDRRVIAHLAAYRVSLHAAITRLYFGGVDQRAANVLSRLRNNGYIKSERLGTKTPLVYYQLDGRAAREYGFPETRAKPFEGSSLARHLAIVWWCCMSETIRYRIEPDQAAQVIGCEALRGEHAIQEMQPLPRLYRLLLVGNKSNKAAMHQLREAIRESMQSPELTEWIKHGKYVFTLLVHKSSKASVLKKALKDDAFRSEYSPTPAIRVYRTAAPDTAHEMINDWKQAQREQNQR